jgi:hypothetical protein
MATDKDIWMEHTYQSKLTDEAARIYDTLPEEVRQSLVAAAIGLYNFGFQHGRAYSGCAAEPVYYVPESRLQIAEQVTDIA